MGADLIGGGRPSLFLPLLGASWEERGEGCGRAERGGQEGRPDLLGEDGDVLVEGVGGADVAASHARFPGSAGRQLALLKDQS